MIITFSFTIWLRISN